MALYSQVLPTLKGRKLLKACTHRAVQGPSLNSDHTRGFSVVIGFSAQLEETSKLVALSCPGHSAKSHVLLTQFFVLACLALGQRGSLCSPEQRKGAGSRHISNFLLSPCCFLRKLREGQDSPGGGQGLQSRAMPHTECLQASGPRDSHANIFFALVRGSRGPGK